MQPDIIDPSQSTESMSNKPKEPIPSSKPLSNKQGMAHHIIFSLISLIILIVLVGGVYEWQHKKVNSLNQQVATEKSEISSLNNKLKSDAAEINDLTSSNSSSSQTNKTYLDITQLGIKFPIPSIVSDLSYTWSNSQATLHSQSWLKYVQTNDPTCAAEAAKASTSSSPPSPPADWVGYVYKITSTDNGEVSPIVTVNGTTYTYQAWQDGCSLSDKGNPKAVNSEQVAITQAMIAALKKATAD